MCDYRNGNDPLSLADIAIKMQIYAHRDPKLWDHCELTQNCP